MFPAVSILGVSRSIDQVAEIHQLKESRPNVFTLACDLSTDIGRNSLIAYLAGKEVRFIVHSAAAMGELSLAETTVEGFRKTMALMVETPLFLTKAVSASIVERGKVLLVSSGAADRYGIVLSPAFSIAKAGLKMLHSVLNAELPHIDTGIVNPGITDTPMLRAWAERHNTESLLWEDVNTTETVARFLGCLLGDTVDGERFRRENWNIYDTEQQKVWVSPGETGPRVPFISGIHP